MLTDGCPERKQKERKQNEKKRNKKSKKITYLQPITIIITITLVWAKLQLQLIWGGNESNKLKIPNFHLLDLHANAYILFFAFLVLFFIFFYSATGPLTRYLETGCSESDQTWQSGRSP